MAIADVAEYAHLSDADLKALGVALDAIRRDIEDSRGEKDRAYIRGAIAFLPSNRYAQIAHRVRAVCATYDLPYANPGEDRRPTLDWSRSVPFGDDDTEVRRTLEAQSAWLAESAVPKLHIAGNPGAIAAVGGRRRDTIGAYPNLTIADVEGGHWLPLDDPHAMGEGLATWLSTAAKSSASARLLPGQSLCPLT